jgi:hypothetical protein
VAVEHRKKGQGKEVKGRNEDRTRKKWRKKRKKLKKRDRSNRVKIREGKWYSSFHLNKVSVHCKLQELVRRAELLSRVRNWPRRKDKHATYMKLLRVLNMLAVLQRLRAIIRLLAHISAVINTGTLQSLYSRSGNWNHSEAWTWGEESNEEYVNYR